MQVAINETYSIESDERNFVLKRSILREARDGVGNLGNGYNEYFDYSYYWNIEDLCKALLQKSLKNSDAQSVEDLQETLQICTSEIVDCLTSQGFKKLHKHITDMRTNGTSDVEDVPVKAKRGRPKGAKNKEKKK